MAVGPPGMAFIPLVESRCRAPARFHDAGRRHPDPPSTTDRIPCGVYAVVRLMTPVSAVVDRVDGHAAHVT